MMSAFRLGAGLGALCLFAAAAAQAQDPAPGAAPDPAPASEAAAFSDDDLASVMETGQKLYLKNCRTCHGSKGTAGVPLAGNAKVQGDYGYLVWAIITGPGYMPELGPALSDQEIAGITTFIMNSWGNDLGLITPENIRDLR